MQFGLESSQPKQKSSELMQFLSRPDSPEGQMQVSVGLLG